MIDNETGEVIEQDTDSVKYQLALRELNQLPAIDEWLDLKEAYETAKERFESCDKPLRRTLKELFQRFQVHRLENDYIDIIQKNGYIKMSWDDEAVERFILQHGGDPNDFKISKWIDGTLQIKYKG